MSAGITGTNASWLRPSLIANGLDPDHLVPPSQRNYDSAGGQNKKWKDIWAAGQGLQTIRRIEPVSSAVEQLEQEYHQPVARLCERANPRDLDRG